MKLKLASLATQVRAKPKVPYSLVLTREKKSEIASLITVTEMAPEYRSTKQYYERTLKLQGVILKNPAAGEFIKKYRDLMLQLRRLMS